MSDDWLTKYPTAKADDWLSKYPTQQTTGQVAKRYAPYFGTGLGEEAARATAGLISGTPAGFAARMMGFSGVSSPQTYQHAAEAVTGAWPQPKTSEEHLAKYAGNVLPYVPLALYAYSKLPTAAQIGLPWTGYQFRKELRGILGL